MVIVIANKSYENEDIEKSIKKIGERVNKKKMWGDSKKLVLALILLWLLLGAITLLPFGLFGIIAYFGILIFLFVIYSNQIEINPMEEISYYLYNVSVIINEATRIKEEQGYEKEIRKYLNRAYSIIEDVKDELPEYFFTIAKTNLIKMQEILEKVNGYYSEEMKLKDKKFEENFCKMLKEFSYALYINSNNLTQELIDEIDNVHRLISSQQKSGKKIIVAETEKIKEKCLNFWSKLGLEVKILLVGIIIGTVMWFVMSYIGIESNEAKVQNILIMIGSLVALYAAIKKKQ